MRRIRGRAAQPTCAARSRWIALGARRRRSASLAHGPLRAAGRARCTPRPGCGPASSALVHRAARRRARVALVAARARASAGTRREPDDTALVPTSRFALAAGAVLRLRARCSSAAACRSGSAPRCSSPPTSSCSGAPTASGDAPACARGDSVARDRRGVATAARRDAGVRAALPRPAALTDVRRTDRVRPLDRRRSSIRCRSG